MFVKRSQGESIALLANVAIGATALALIALVVAFQSVVAAMTDASDWAIGWIWETFYALAITAGVLSLASLQLMLRWRGKHDRGPWYVMVLFGSVALGGRAATWAWIEFWAYR